MGRLDDTTEEVGDTSTVLHEALEDESAVLHEALDVGADHDFL
jgi:hypothetical protein